VLALFRNFRFRKIRFSFSHGEGRAARGFFLLQLPTIIRHNHLISQDFSKGEKSSEKSENPAEKT
jgi:hypothetical protein